MRGPASPVTDNKDRTHLDLSGENLLVVEECLHPRERESKQVCRGGDDTGDAGPGVVRPVPSNLAEIVAEARTGEGVESRRTFLDGSFHVPAIRHDEVWKKAGVSIAGEREIS